MSLEDILRGLLGGEGELSSQGGDPLGDLIQGLLGGGGAVGQEAGAVNPLEGILGGLGDQDASMAGLGGGGLMEIIASILGGGMGGGSSASPIVDGVASKLNLPSAIAQMIVAFVLSKLLGSVGGGGLGSLGGLLPTPSAESAGEEATGAAELDLDSLLERMGGEQEMAQELASQTGLDADTARQGLQEVLGRLGQQARGSQAAKPKSGGLDGLLDSW